ncbi:uncharacterized protein LOC107044960 [Diachasma alloeum]|uniref:uncharacterized protein LOC107044960 n=1 Tax=Diachasma alloeum TaxID=454923 RepID=UPI000738273F|nr:uncharacterized protein LOC107044960 [Diachasma alloeum]
MAAPPLGKCMVLPLFLLLVYVGYGFRIRDIGQAGSIEHGECPLGSGKCPGETGGQVTFNSLKKRIESVGGTRGRIVSGSARQPPVEVEDGGEEERVSEQGKSRSRILSKMAESEGRDSAQREDDDSEDEKDGIVEENGSDETEEVTIDDDTEDDDKGNESEEVLKNQETVKREIKWSFHEVRKGEEPSNKENDHDKATAIHKHIDGNTVSTKSEEELKNDDKEESEESEDRDESPKDEDDTDEASVEEKKKEEKPVRKLEKVRLADKAKVKPTEAPVVRSVEEETEKQEPAKMVDTPRNVIVKPKIEKEKPKPIKPTPPKVEEKKIKVPKPAPTEDKKIKEQEVVVESNKEKEKPVKESAPEKLEEKPITKKKSKLEGEAQEKEKKKSKEKPKESEKVNPAKEKGKSKEKLEDEPKDKTEAKIQKAEVTVNKESEPNKKKPDQSKKYQEGSISLIELNEMILHVPNFVPNFAAVEDPVCQQHGKIFLRQLRGRKLWALQMLDSGGKIPSGLLRGNVNQFGDFDQCLGISSKIRLDNKQTLRIQGKYCLAAVDIQATIPETKVPVHLMQSRGFLRGSLKDSGHFVPRFTTINWALCVPSACSAADTRSAIEAGLSHLNETSGVKFVVDVNPDMCYIQEKSQSYSKETIGVLYFYAMIVCLVLIATVRDYIVVSEKASYSERIIMAFSLRRTLKSLMKPISPHSGDISCIHGIRALATIALYVGHKMIPTVGMPYTNRIVLTEIANNPVSSLLRVSLVYTDSFLLLSGVLTAFHMARESTKRGEIRWFCRFIARIIRLTPSLVVVIFWYAYVMEHTGSGPQWNNIITPNADLCKKNSWTNFFYIQNFFPFEEMCATHTHQLALDMQLSLLSPGLVFFLLVKPIIGILLIFFFLQVSATLRYFATANNNLSLVIFHGMTAKHLYKTANLTYAVSLHRATPYLFGISLGVLLQYTGKNIKIYKIFVIFGWITTALLAAWSLFSPWKMARRDYVYNVEEAAHYAVIGPVSWALGVCWVIFACFTDHGSFINKFLSNYWLVLFSRISYSVYLTQFAVFFYNVATTRYSSEFHVLKVVDPFEILTVISISVILTLFLDIPTQEIKKVLMESTDVSQSSKSQSPLEPKTLKPGSRKPSKTPEPQEYEENASWKMGQIEADYSEEEDSHWIRSRKPNGKQRVFIRRNSRDDDGYRPWGMKREETLDRRRSSSIQRTLHIDPDTRVREPTPSRHAEDTRRERRSSSRAPDPSMKISHRPEDRRSPRRDRSTSRLSDLGFYREPESPVPPRPPKPEIRGRSPRLRRTPVRLISSGSEEEPKKLRGKSPRRPVERPKVSDEEDWEQELRIRRQKFKERMASTERQELKTERDESTDVSRRSSAEGKIALLQGPTGTRVMDAWTVSKGPRVSVASSQEPTDTEEESRYIRDFEDEPIPERRGSLDSLEKAEIDFSFRSDVKTKTLMDLRQISVEDEGCEQRGEVVGEMTPVATGKLFKRESIIKSQASEEDPEYLLPERPKLVEQEQEHPFKKAWQMQKSRSEEDGPSAFVFKEVRPQPEAEQGGNEDSKSANDSEGHKSTCAGPTEQTFHLIVEDVDSGHWQRSGRSEGSRSSVTGSSVTGSSEDIEMEIGEEEVESSRQSRNEPEDYSRVSTRSNGTESLQLDWPSEDDQFERYRRQRREFEAWEQENEGT